MRTINLAGKFNLIHEAWSPRIAGELNDSYIKLAKLKGEFVWQRRIGSPSRWTKAWRRSSRGGCG